jgi:asparagine synthase (glutamine-hydrolysing)
MTAAMAYRGADGINHLVSGNAAFGHCLLHTTPESLEERQPLSNESGSLFLVLDGRVDNRRALTRELLRSGAVFRDHSDGELVLRAYERWSTACAERLDGDFAFVVWDVGRQQAYCARDRMGKKPFYYWRSRESLVFATDFHAILAMPGSPQAINEGMLAEHLMVDIRNLDETLIQGIQRLPPATWQLVSADEQQSRGYWDVNCGAEIRYKDDREYAEHFLDLLRTTVRHQMRSVGPVGIYLSGGIDSSAIACIAAEIAEEAGQLEAFSVLYPGRDCDETPYIESVLEKCRLKGNFVKARGRPFENYVEDIERFKDLTDGPNGAETRRLRSMATARGFRVMLDGYGGDEWFDRSAFYYHYLIKSMNVAELSRQLWFDLSSESLGAAGTLRKFLQGGLIPFIPGRCRETLRRLKNFSRGRRQSQPEDFLGLVTAGFADRVGLRNRLSPGTNCSMPGQPSHFRRHQLVHYGWNVRGREIGSRLEAMYNLEERSPLNDHRIIEFAFAIPEEQRSRFGGKYLIKEAMREMMPEKVRSRNDKAEFSSLIGDVLRHTSCDYGAPTSRLVSSGYIDGYRTRSRYESFCRKYDAGTPDYSGDDWRLWIAMILEIWTWTADVQNSVQSALLGTGQQAEQQDVG